MRFAFFSPFISLLSPQIYFLKIIYYTDVKILKLTFFSSVELCIIVSIVKGVSNTLFVINLDSNSCIRRFCFLKISKIIPNLCLVCVKFDVSSHSFLYFQSVVKYFFKVSSSFLFNSSGDSILKLSFF